MKNKINSKLMFSIKLASSLLIATSVFNSSMADTIINFAVDDDVNNQTNHRVVYVSSGKVRLINDQGSIDPDAIFDSSTNTLTLIDHQKQSYMNLSEQQIEQISGQVNDLLGGILDGLQLDKDILTGGTSDIKTKHSGLEKKVSGYSCNLFEIYKDGSKVSDVCFSTYNRLNINSQDYETLDNMYKTGGRIAEKIKSVLGDSLGPIPEFNVAGQNGLPIYIHSYDQNNLTISLQNLKEEAVNGDVFNIPAGYAQKDIMSMIP